MLNKQLEVFPSFDDFDFKVMVFLYSGPGFISIGNFTHFTRRQGFEKNFTQNCLAIIDEVGRIVVIWVVQDGQLNMDCAGRIVKYGLCRTDS